MPVIARCFLLEWDKWRKKTKWDQLTPVRLENGLKVVVRLSFVPVSDYVQLLDLNGRVKTARRHHSVVDMQFEFRIEALGNSSHLCVFLHDL